MVGLCIFGSRIIIIFKKGFKHIESEMLCVLGFTKIQRQFTTDMFKPEFIQVFE